MGVVRATKKKGRRASVKARRPWSRRIVTGGSDAKYRSVIPRIRNPDYGYPDKLVTKLRYVDKVLLDAAVEGIGANVFRMNSLFDPDFTGVGHQPMYFDQLCGAVGSAPYSRYRVLGSKMTVTFSPKVESFPALAQYGPYTVGIISTATSGIYAGGVSALCEASNCDWTVIGEKAGGSNVKSLTCTYSPPRDLGVDTGDDTIAAAYNANPSQVFYASPWKSDQNGQGGGVFGLVEIVYTVEFFDRNEVAQS